MLGHLSLQRNSAQLAVRDVKLQFERAQVPIAFDLSTAPRVEPSKIIRLG
jgi:hypothetical protein